MAFDLGDAVLHLSADKKDFDKAVTSGKQQAAELKHEFKATEEGSKKVGQELKKTGQAGRDSGKKIKDGMGDAKEGVGGVHVQTQKLGALMLSTFATGGAIAIGVGALRNSLGELTKEAAQGAAAILAEGEAIKQLAQISTSAADLDEKIKWARAQAANPTMNITAPQAMRTKFAFESLENIPQSSHENMLRLNALFPVTPVLEAVSGLTAATGGRAGTPEQIAAMFAAGAKTSKFDIQKLAEAVTRTGAGFTQAGVSPEEIIAAVSAVSPQITSPELIASGLKAFLATAREKGLSKGGGGLQGIMDRAGALTEDERVTKLGREFNAFYDAMADPKAKALFAETLEYVKTQGALGMGEGGALATSLSIITGRPEFAGPAYEQAMQARQEQAELRAGAFLPFAKGAAIEQQTRLYESAEAINTLAGVLPAEQRGIVRAGQPLFRWMFKGITNKLAETYPEWYAQWFAGDQPGMPDAEFPNTRFPTNSGESIFDMMARQGVDPAYYGLDPADYGVDPAIFKMTARQGMDPANYGVDTPTTGGNVTVITVNVATKNDILPAIEAIEREQDRILQ